MKKNNRILLLSAVVLFLIIYPYTKEVEIFRAEDVNWEILSHTKKYKEFDPRTFALTQTYDFTEKILSLDKKQISIKGFVKKHKHGDHTDIIITESVTDVCFMCNHDEHYNMIFIYPKNKNSKIYNIEDDTLIKVSGKFIIDKRKSAHSIFSIKKAKLEKIEN